MLPRVSGVLTEWLASGARGMGQIEIRQGEGGFALSHHEDSGRKDLERFSSPNDAGELAKFDDAGNFRPLKTAPNLRHGWRLELADLAALQEALELFYPGRLAALVAWEAHRLTATPLRATLDRQTGMYRVAAKITNEEMDALVGRFCRSQGGEPGCLRTILWARDASGARPSLRLPLDKFIAPLDQTGRGENVLPLLCQEACNLLVAEARRVVKKSSSSGVDE
ncbi:MAG TPA: DR2241 family protein [Chthoniobacterales bacterium]|jgi:sirohydrochlorin cobaltochelatase|nr:DR2241 family protein [Chthoniobacterales bacterium]